MPCPPCKIILDGGVIGAASSLYANTAEIIGNAFAHAIEIGSFDAADVDHAHALSELWCHRAALLRQWAEEDRLIATEMLGGEYHGGWTIDGVKGIEPTSA